MNYFNFKTDQDGQLIYVTNLGVRYTDPIISDTIPYPTTGADHTGTATHTVELEGEQFKLEIFHRKRTGMFEPWAEGVKLYSSEGKLLSDTYLYGRYPGGYRLSGRRMFRYKGARYLLFSGSLGLYKYDKERYPQFEEGGLRLIKFNKKAKRKKLKWFKKPTKSLKQQTKEAYLNAQF